jgi:hypothetical protein
MTNRSAVERRESPSDAMIVGRIIFFAAGNEQPLKGRVLTLQALFWRGIA